MSFRNNENDNRSCLLLALVLSFWCGVIIFSIASGHFDVPDELANAWHNFEIATHDQRLAGIVQIIVLAIPVTIVSFLLGPILLPLEIIVFPILALVTQNGFWLTMVIVWKYALLFTIAFGGT